MLIAIFSAVSIFLSAQEKNETEIANRMELFRLAMISADGNSLDELIAEKLSYGHSSGLVEDKKEFIRKITSSENVYVKINITNQSVTISGNAAIVRNQFEAETIGNAKAGALKLLVLWVWQKQGKEWKLLARQADKILP